MSTRLSIPQKELVEIPSPFQELPQMEPRRADILTLIDGKTFLCTTVAGDITPPGAPDAGADEYGAEQSVRARAMGCFALDRSALAGRA